MRVLCLCSIAVALVIQAPGRLAAQAGSTHPKCDNPDFR